MNVYETAILRILIKRNQHPITIHSMIEGFPDGSEVDVINAILHLKDSGLVSILPGFPEEEEYVIYNLEMKEKILKIIDPMVDKEKIDIKAKIKENNNNVIHNTYNNNNNTNTVIFHNRRRKRNNKENNRIQKQKPIRPVGIIMSIIFVLSFSLIANVNAQSNVMYTVLDTHSHVNPHKHHQASFSTGLLHTKSLKVVAPTIPLVKEISTKIV